MKLLVRAIVNSQSESAQKFNQSSSSFCVESYKIADAIDRLRDSAIAAVDESPIEVAYLVNEVRTFED